MRASDLIDAEWAVLEPEARAVMAGLIRAQGRPMVHNLRAMVDAIGYVVRYGIEWRALPADFLNINIFWSLAQAHVIISDQRWRPPRVLHRLLDHGSTSHVGWGVAGAAIGILGNQLVALYKLVIGRRIPSATLVADGNHSWLDALSSALARCSARSESCSVLAGRRGCELGGDHLHLPRRMGGH